VDFCCDDVTDNEQRKAEIMATHTLKAGIFGIVFVIGGLFAAMGSRAAFLGENGEGDGTEALVVMQPQASSEAETFKVDPVHSSAVFSVEHLGVSRFYGRFNKMSGTFTIDTTNPEKSSIQVEIPAESIDTNAAGRDRDLKGPDFFDAKQFPTLSFTSTKIAKSGENRWTVTGDFTLHGVTKALTCEIEIVGYGKTPMGYRGGLATTFTIKRSDFGMTKYVKEGMLGDEVTVMLGLEGVKQ